MQWHKYSHTLNHTQATSSKATELHGYKDILHIKLNMHLSHIYLYTLYILSTMPHHNYHTKECVRSHTQVTNCVDLN